MKTRIEEAAREYGTHKKDCTCKGNHFVEDKYKGFIAGAEFVQKEAEFWETFVKGLTKDLSFHQDLNKEKFEEIKKLKAQDEIMKEALIVISNLGNNYDHGKHRDAAFYALEKAK